MRTLQFRRARSARRRTVHLHGDSRDRVGLISPFSTPFTVTVDNTPPAISSFGLDSAFEATAFGQNMTVMPTVTLDGQTIPGATVELVETGATTTADSSGNFSFYPVNMPTLAAYTFTVQVTDVAGNMSTLAGNIHPRRQHAAVEPASARRDAQRFGDDGPYRRHGEHLCGHGDARRQAAGERSPADQRQPGCAQCVQGRRRSRR